MSITEKQAREASDFIVDWLPKDLRDSHKPQDVQEQSFSDYPSACAFARKVAKREGSACLMPVIDGKKAAQWTYSDRYPRHFEA